MFANSRSQSSESEMSAPLTVSVVVPVYDEVDNIDPLVEQINAAMGNSGYVWELIFVDDGSTDGSTEKLRTVHAENDTVSIIEFRRNFGQTAALEAGIRAARNEVIVTMDADQQNDPADIPHLLKLLEEGYDLVAGWRVDRQDPFFTRTLPSKIANALISFTTGTHLHDYGCTLKAIRRDVATRLKLSGEMHRFIPAIAANLGATLTELPVHHRPRTKGRTKYGIGRTFRVILDLVTVKFLSAYSTRPAHVFGFFGLLSFAGGSAITIALGVGRLFFGLGLSDRPLLLLGILLLITGLQFMSMGLFGEILCRIYHEEDRNPAYLIRNSLAPRHVVSTSLDREEVVPGNGVRVAGVPQGDTFGQAGPL